MIGADVSETRLCGCVELTRGVGAASKEEEAGTGAAAADDSLPTSTKSFTFNFVSSDVLPPIRSQKELILSERPKEFFGKKRKRHKHKEENTRK